MPHFFSVVLRALLQMGYLGPLFLGAADSSFLFLPFGNDLLIVILVARHHTFWIYCLAAALGSSIGVFFVDTAAKKLGEAGVQKLAGKKRFEHLREKINQRGSVFVALASLAPPPFPFTILVATTSALGYSRKKLLALVFTARLARFVVLSLLALRYGHGILRVINTEAFKYAAIGLAIVCLVVTGFSIAKWVRSGRAEPSRAAA